MKSLEFLEVMSKTISCRKITREENVQLTLDSVEATLDRRWDIIFGIFFGILSLTPTFKMVKELI